MLKKDQIIVDKQSGATLERPGYQALKGQLGLRAGDVLYICSLDRLSRNKNDLKNEIRWFQEHDVRLMILDFANVNDTGTERSGMGNSDGGKCIN